MPLDNGSGLNQHHRLQAAWPSSIEPHPQQAITCAEPRSTRPLSAENNHLMSEGQQLKFQGGSPPKPEGDQRSHRGQDRKHADHDTAVRSKLQCLLPDLELCAATGLGRLRIVSQRFLFATECGKGVLGAYKSAHGQEGGSSSGIDSVTVVETILRR